VSVSGQREDLVVLGRILHYFGVSCDYNFDIAMSNIAAPKRGLRLHKIYLISIPFPEPFTKDESCPDHRIR
jgi:hypothetical protein